MGLLVGQWVRGITPQLCQATNRNTFEGFIVHLDSKIGWPDDLYYPIVVYSWDAKTDWTFRFFQPEHLTVLS